MDFLNLFLGSIQEGLIWAVLALGVFITYRILDVADLGCEGVFPLGAIISALLIKNGVNPGIALIVSCLAGVLCGLLTAFLHTICKIPFLLSGIIVLTALYSITLMVSKGISNISLPILNGSTVYTWAQKLFKLTGMNESLANQLGIILVAGLFTGAVVAIMYWFFGTQLGIAIRATGRNSRMAKASGISTKIMIFIGLALSNALIAMSGSLFAQYNGFADINSGRGTIVIGLATIILGESIFGKRSFKNNLLSIVGGTWVYFFIIRIALKLGLDTNYLKLLYSVIIVIVLVFPVVTNKTLRTKRFIESHKIADDPELALKVSARKAQHQKNIEARNARLLQKEIDIDKAENEKLELRLKDEKYKAKFDLQYAKQFEVKPEDEEHGDIILTNVVKSFNVNGQEKTVLKGVNLTINEGDFITVIGGNGSGKTTLLNCIAGMYKVDEGFIHFGKEEITTYSENKRARFMSRVFQDPNLGTCGDMSIEQNMCISLNRGKPSGFNWCQNIVKRNFFRNKLKELDLGLENRLQARANELSGGQRQALTLIMANLKKPNLLLLDEHCAALDPKTAEKVMNVTDKIVNENHITTLMITHNMKDAIKYGNRLIMINSGRIILDVKGKEKEKLTVEDLLKKFKESDNFEYDDTLILG